jgi:hypothetical protein
MDLSTKLSNNFRLAEFVKSEIAIRLDINNTPPEEAVLNLTKLCHMVLQPVRDYFGKVVNVSSGFRCLVLNRELKSSDRSQHLKGMAADIEIYGIDNYDLAKWIADNIPVYDQLILEFYEGGNTGWVHVSYNPDGHNRRENLTINGGNIMRGLIKWKAQ